MRITYAVAWAKPNGHPRLFSGVPSTDLDELIESLLEEGAETNHITIEVEL